MKLLAFLFLFSELSPDVSRAEKTVFVNCVHFFTLASPTFGYEDDISVADRPLDWDSSMSFEESVLQKAEYILDIGGDVYQYAVPFGYYNTSSVTYNPAEDFKRLRDIHDILVSNNIDLKLNFETSGFDTHYNSGKFTVSNMTAFLDYAATNVYNWSKIFKYENKAVFTLWDMFGDDGGSLISGFTTSVYAQVISGMASGNRDKLYIINDSFHNYLCDTNDWDSAYVRGLLQDGLFDNIELWGTTTDPDSDAARQGLLKSDIQSVDSSAPFSVCMSHGYFRSNTQAFKRQYGTRHFFDHWKTRVTDSSPEWITVITLDDYTENHHIEPSALNNGFWISLLKTVLKSWRGESNTLPAEYWLAAPQTDVWGQNMYMEVVELNSAATDHKMKVNLQDQDGDLFSQCLAKVEDAAYCDGAVKTYRFDYSVTNMMQLDTKVLRPVVYRYSDTGSFQRTYWGCPPTRLFYSTKPGPLYRYTPLHNLISVSGDSGAAVSNAVYTDLAEYRRSVADYTLDAHGADLAYAEVRGWLDHIPVFSTNFSSGSTASLNRTVDSRDLRDAAAMTYVYYQTENGKLYYSAPSIQTNDFTGGLYYLYDKTILDSDYNNTYSSFDEIDPYFRFNDKESMVANWDFTQTSTITFKTVSYPVVPGYRNYWGRPLYLGYGPNKKTYSGTVQNEPTVVASGLSFDGSNDVCRMSDHILPEGAYGVYLKFNTDVTGREQVLVYSKGLTEANVLIGINSSNQIYFERNDERVTSASTVSSGVDYAVWFYDNCEKQAIAINGSYDAVRTYTSGAKNLSTHRYNDLILIGDNHNHLDGDAFDGTIKKVMVVSGLPMDGYW